jgi:DNA-binding IclR family transcriptional regulator
VTGWTLLSNHGLALVCIAGRPGMRLRDIADRVGVTERAAHRIVSDLCEAGYVSRERVGRRSFYEVHADVPLRHDLLSDRTLGDLLSGLLRRTAPESEAAA